MSGSLYITATEARSRKSAIALGVMEILLRQVKSVGFSRPIITASSTPYKKDNGISLITVLLGNGASMAALQKGECIDTTMGMTPLSGLVMGTRSGDVDPALPFFSRPVGGGSQGY